MELGEKIKQARLEAGLSQRQLCGDKVTRNMLSQIENGTARPSMETLRCFAARLGKPLSWFLDENTVLSPNRDAMDAARRWLEAGDLDAAAKALEGYVPPDETYDREYRLMLWQTEIALGERAIDQGREPYALQYFRRAESLEALPPLCHLPELRPRRLLAQARLRGACLRELSSSLPDLDGELLLKAAAALETEDGGQATRLLDACAHRESPQWNYLRGRCYLLEKDFPQAEGCFHRAEKDYPRQVYPLLEQCCREQEDYRQAYYYACKQR